MEEEITSMIKSSRQAPPGFKVRRNAARNFFSRPRERHDHGCGDDLVCERNTFNIIGVFTGGDQAAIGSGTTCVTYMLT